MSAKNPQYKVRTFTCIGCKEIITKRTPAKAIRYCSLPCYRSSERPSRKTGKTFQCETCKVDVYKSISLTNPHKFCSKSCADVWWKSQPRVRFTCKTCNQEFSKHPSIVKNRKYATKYCSMECRNKCPEWNTAYIKGNVAQSHKRGPNKLEIAGSKLLTQLNIKFEEEHLLFEKFLVDIYIPSKKIVIQWDGEYWHGHPSKLKNGIPDKRQAKRMALDKSQDQYFKKAGLKVLRFWESEVLTKGDKVSDTIRTAVQ